VSVTVNGEESHTFKTGEGLRQGVPYPPPPIVQLCR
jgi:hypothetical protein